MSKQEIAKELTVAIMRGERFGPSGANDPDRQVPPKVLRDVLLRDSVKSKGKLLWLDRVQLNGPLDLEAQSFAFRLRFEGCRFHDALNLFQAQAPNLIFANCQFHGYFSADELTIRSNLELDGSVAHSGIGLRRSRIGGRLSLSGVKATARETEDGVFTAALNADGINVVHDVYCQEGFRATGEVRLIDAKFGGQFSLRGAKLEAKTASDGSLDALSIDRAEVGAGIICSGLSAQGKVRMADVKVGGQLSLASAKLEAQRGGDGSIDALSLDRAEIAGGIVCDGLSAQGQVRMPSAKCGGQFSMDGASLEAKEIADGVFTAAFNADGIEIEQSVFFQSGFSAVGEVRFLDAEIGGRFTLKEAELEVLKKDKLHDALNLDSVVIAGDTVCNDFSAIGNVVMSGVKVGGALLMEATTLEASESQEGVFTSALNADGIEVVQDAHFGPGFRALGEVRLIEARIDGQLSITDAELHARETSDHSLDALCIDRAVITGGLSCIEVSAKGQIRMSSTRIGGHLVFRKSRLDAGHDDGGPPHSALLADRIQVTGSLFADGGLTAIGGIRLLGARVVGQLSLHNTRLEGGRAADGTLRPALSAEGLEVTGSMYCGKEFIALGEIRLLDANIGGVLSMDEAKLEGRLDDESPPEPSLSADRARVGGNLFCRYGFSAIGRIRLLSVKIGGQLSFTEATLTTKDPSQPVLSLVGSVIDELIFGSNRITGSVDLRDARIRSLWDADDGEFVGFLPDSFRMEGLRYESLREPLDAKQRLKWLDRSQGERHYPDVYAQLAEAFRQIGRRADARKVGVANERRARKDLPRWSPRRPLHDFLWLTVGYGYRNWQAAGWLVALIALGSFLFSCNESAFMHKGHNPPPFEPVIYAVDATVPVLSLSQTNWWSATGCMAWVELSLAIMGYALAAAVIAAAAGVFNRDQV